MKICAPCTFEPGLIKRAAQYSPVREFYGKIASDDIGGGRSSYTLRSVGKRGVEKTIKECHSHNIRFNYLLNAANLGGMEQTRKGQRRIRKMLDWLCSAKTDGVTVASPLLLRIIKKQYPSLKVKIGVFAVVDNPVKAKEWEDMGADEICLSAIACNRNFRVLENIRSSVSCGLQLITNASCLLHCTHELTHMNLLSQSSRKNDPSGGFCLDYCILHCSRRRIQDPVNFIRATWIRPEDLHLYEEIGYDSFKLVERSCPTDQLITRIKAYSERSFKGNLLEIAGPVAKIKKEQNLPWHRRLRMALMLARPDKVSLKSMIMIKKFAQDIIPDRYGKNETEIYIDSTALCGFLEKVRGIDCLNTNCDECGICGKWAEKAVHINPQYRKRLQNDAEELDRKILEGSLW